MTDTPTPFKTLFDDYRDEIGRALKLQMKVDKRAYRSLAPELGMTTTTLNAIALGTRSSQNGVRKFEHYMVVQHWLGTWPVDEEKPARLTDLWDVLGRMNLPAHTREMLEGVLIAILRDVALEDAT